MNYEKLYFAFIEKFKQQKFPKDTYTETHHIVPKHDGGDNSKQNLVVVSYRQHVFIHRLRFKAFKQHGDLVAYRLMSSLEADKKRFICSMAGKIGGAVNVASGHITALGKRYGQANGRNNVENGFLDEIRKLANTEQQRKHASELGKQNVESGQLERIRELANEANRNREKSEEERQLRSQIMQRRLKQDDSLHSQLIEMNIKAVVAKKQMSEDLWEFILDNAQRNIEFLNKKSSKSKYKFVSPEGLEFESPIFAANYYGNTTYYVIENWCKREQHGWKRILKTESD